MTKCFNYLRVIMCQHHYVVENMFNKLCEHLFGEKKCMKNVHGNHWLVPSLRFGAQGLVLYQDSAVMELPIYLKLN